MSGFFSSGGQSVGASSSASLLPMSIQGWFFLGLTGLISLLSKGFLRVFSNTTIWKHKFFSALLTVKNFSIYIDDIFSPFYSPGGGHGYPLQYSCLGNPGDRGAWRATVHGVTKEHDWATNTFVHTFHEIRKLHRILMLISFIGIQPCLRVQTLSMTTFTTTTETSNYNRDLLPTTPEILTVLSFLESLLI